MCKYIDAEKLSELCKGFDASSNKNFLEEQILSFLYHVFIPKVLEETPHVDAVEVVRCKDCKNWEVCTGHTRESRYNWCDQFMDYSNKDDFCCHAEEYQKCEADLF